MERVGITDYRIDFGGKVKVYHINMLKRFHQQESAIHGASALSYESDEEAGVDDVDRIQPILCEPKQNENWTDADVCPSLSEVEKNQIKSLLQEYSDILSDKPGVTNLSEHKIILTTNEPVRVKPYPLPYNVRKEVEKEVQQMLELNVIEPSESPYSSPLHLVKKKDGTYRPVIDFRKLNKVTVFDSEPMPNPDEKFSKLVMAKYFSKLDFTKGFWQIPMREEEKDKTSFNCTLGAFRFTKMPFGLVNSGAAYNRMMRKLLHGLANVDSFVDDVIIFAETFEHHLEVIRTVFERVRAAGLTINPSKCIFGFESVDFVGHHVGGSALNAMSDKVAQIQKAVRPQTKKQIRSFLGLSSYYRKFVPNFAAIAVPLTDATRKGAPNQVMWTEAMQNAFDTLKQRLSSTPILQLPDWNKPFVVRSDASDIGIGAVLLQEDDNILKPVAYISRKLLPREIRYPTIEKECLGIVWAIDKFQVYLYGREFTLQNDHKPLSFMDKAKLTNARVMRRAVALQPFRFTLEAIPGRENVGADFMSRSVMADDCGLVV